MMQDEDMLLGDNDKNNENGSDNITVAGEENLAEYNTEYEANEYSIEVSEENLAECNTEYEANEYSIEVSEENLAEYIAEYRKNKDTESSIEIGEDNITEDSAEYGENHNTEYSVETCDNNDVENNIENSIGNMAGEYVETISDTNSDNKESNSTAKKETRLQTFVSKLKKTHRKRLVLRAICFLFAASAAIIFLMPTVLTIANSFMAESEINANYGVVFSTNELGVKKYMAEAVNLKLIPDMVSFSQYFTVLLKSPSYLLKFWNSVILVVPITIFQLLTACLASYGFARTQGKIKSIIFFSYIILMLMPYQVTLVPNYLVSEWFKILNTNWAIWLPGIFSPFSVYLLTKYMRRIPTALFEAAQIDGAGEWQMFRKIAMPICKGAIYSCAILVFIDYWNMVEQPLILFKDVEKYPLSVFLSQINSGEIGLAFAVATIYMIPGILIFLYSEEYLVEGITYQGGIKG